MTNQAARDQLLQELNVLLEAYGSDRSRWPAAMRLRLSAFIASEPKARRALAEAEALDRVLDRAPFVSVDRQQALAQRIVAAATGAAPDARAGAGGGRVVPFRSNIGRSSAGVPSRRYAAGALMAASLVLGVFAGSKNILSSSFDTLAYAVGWQDSGGEAEMASYIGYSGTTATGEESL